MSDDLNSYTIQRLAEINEKHRLSYNTTNWRGYDWWQLSEEDEFVFSLDLEDMPLLIAVFSVYQCVLPITDSDLSKEEYEFCRATISEFSWFTKDNIEEKEWLRFAALFGISNRTAMAFHQKHYFWEVRNTGVTYSDEKQP